MLTRAPLRVEPPNAPRDLPRAAEVPYNVTVPVRTPAAVWIATVVAALLSVPATYASMRAYEVVFRTEPNPARVVWTPHIAMYWRLGVGIYVAGMVAVLAYVSARRDVAKTVRLLSWSVLVIASMIAVQGLWMP
jgi:hypothetical protein